MKINVKIYQKDYYAVIFGPDIYVYPPDLIGQKTVTLTLDCCKKCDESDDSEYDCYECDSGTCNGKYYEKVSKGTSISKPWECTQVPCN
ncbi:MAG: hypothetical protein LBE12_20830 [Planctomycetaceae bacterium]|nr:hypothetical protein [Planctomycetaceae bacterium]